MLVKALITIVVIELIFFIFISYIRTKNQWFITFNDKRPAFEKETLSKIIEKSYDPILGWDRKPNTSGVEYNENRVAKWSINSNGARDNLGYNDKESSISVFGDSFTFAREVNNEDTWAHKLSGILDVNVANYGVGNFGFDQALIKLANKLKSESFRPKTVIIGVVPDTVSRILSMWKHYYEFGNIFGFKPRYILNNNELELIPNKINSKEKFETLNMFLPEIQKHDFFYKKKFRKEIIKFPFTINFIRNLKRNVILSYETLKNGKIQKPTPYIMRKNLQWRLNLYKVERNVELLVEQLKIFEKLSLEYNFKACFLIMPQKDDVSYIKQSGNHFYSSLIDKVPKGINCIDVYPYLGEKNETDLKLLYSEQSEYGGHYSPKGNDLIANILYSKINF